MPVWEGCEPLCIARTGADCGNHAGTNFGTAATLMAKSLARTYDSPHESRLSRQHSPRRALCGQCSGPFVEFMNEPDGALVRQLQVRALAPSGRHLPNSVLTPRDPRVRSRRRPASAIAARRMILPSPRPILARSPPLPPHTGATGHCTGRNPRRIRRGRPRQTRWRRSLPRFLAPWGPCSRPASSWT